MYLEPDLFNPDPLYGSFMPEVLILRPKNLSTVQLKKAGVN